jgi:hypothetical protein
MTEMVSDFDTPKEQTMDTRGVWKGKERLIEDLEEDAGLDKCQF